MMIELFCKKLMERTKNVKFDIYGIDKVQPIGLTIILKLYQLKNGPKFKQRRSY